MAGPNNLLGRLALKTIWPDEYGALKEVAEIPVKKATVPVKSQSRSVAGADLPQRQRVSPEPAVPRALPDHSQQQRVGPAPTNDMTAAGQQQVPPRRQAPPLPAGNITEQMGRKYCKELCALYPEIFDGQKGQHERDLWPWTPRSDPQPFGTQQDSSGGDASDSPSASGPWRQPSQKAA